MADNVAEYVSGWIQYEPWQIRYDEPPADKPYGRIVKGSGPSAEIPEAWDFRVLAAGQLPSAYVGARCAKGADESEGGPGEIRSDGNQ
jgi:hypothetical protein